MRNLSTARTTPGAAGQPAEACLPTTASHPRQNSLLAALPDEDYRRVAPLLQEVTLKAGQLLGTQATRHRQFYFPVSAVLSLQYALEDGTTSEIASIGHEGLFGVSLFMDEATASSQALVQAPGNAYCGSAEGFYREFQRGAALQRLAMCHMQNLFLQMALTATCNRSHTVEQRLCRWLLGVLERGTVRELFATHERLACILGVRRESVTTTAGRMQQDGVIRYRRGRIAVLDARELEQRSCSCHGMFGKLYRHPLYAPGPPPAPISFAGRLVSVPAGRPAVRAAGSSDLRVAAP